MKKFLCFLLILTIVITQIVTVETFAASNTHNISEDSHAHELSDDAHDHEIIDVSHSLELLASNTNIFLAAAHTHSYSSASCTSPRRCSCGATSGSSLGHSYGSATCTSAAKCSRCGATSGSSLGHSYFHSFEAAHPHRGYTKCSRCGDWWYNGQTTSLSNCCTCQGHSYSAATCTTAAKCSRCGATSSPLGHSLSTATCTSASKCSRCGVTSGSPLGHSYSSATCTNPVTCSRCGATLGEALGHNYTHKFESGHPHKGYTQCTKCGNWWYNGESLANSNCCACVGHNNSGATCTVAGKCSRCETPGSTIAHNYVHKFQDTHPHSGYTQCTMCGNWWNNGETQTKSDCCSCTGKHNFTGGSCTVPSTCKCGAQGTTTDHKYEHKFRDAHPHAGYTQCALCGNWWNNGEVNELWSNVYYEQAHPHKNYKRCKVGNCAEFIYTGTNYVFLENTVSTEDSHPHKNYQKCLVSGCTGKEYTGTNTASWVMTDLQEFHEVGNGHAQYRLCSCGATEKNGKFVSYLASCETCNNHVHDYSKATCTTPAKCKTCGSETGSPLKHEYEHKYAEEHPHKDKTICKNCGDWWYPGTNHEMWLSTDIDITHYSNLGHKQIKICSCGQIDSTGNYLPLTDNVKCKTCNPEGHIHNWVPSYEASHPHKEYQRCSTLHDGIRVFKYTGGTELVVSCPECPIPDLVITEISTNPSSPVNGDTVTLAAKIKNIGRGASPNGVVHGVQFFVDGVQVDGVTSYTSSIPVGGTVNISGTWSGVTEGTHTITVKIDTLYDRILELDENNNELVTFVGVENSIKRYINQIKIYYNANVTGFSSFEAWMSATYNNIDYSSTPTPFKYYYENVFNKDLKYPQYGDWINIFGYIYPPEGTGNPGQGTGNPPPVTTVKLVIGGKVISSARMYNGEPVADFSDLAFTLGDNVMGVPDVRDTITISYRRPDGGYGEVTYNQSDLIHISDHEHWFPIIRMANDMQYGGQVHTFSNSDGSQGIYIDLYSLVQYASPEALLDAAQTGLDLVGLIPVVGEPADGANSIIYLARGDEVNAALSAASLVPIGGWVSTGGKLVNKTIKCVTKYGDDVFEGVVKLTNATEYFSKVSTKTKVVGSYPPSHTASQVLRDELKTAGVATPPYLNAAHHIIPWDDPRALDARKILDEFGIEYNSASNGVFLPMGAAKYVTNETIHVGNHGPAYISYITNALRDVKAAGGNQADIIETLSDIRAKLLDGTLKLN